jgi:hypothetical protein
MNNRKDYLMNNPENNIPPEELFTHTAADGALDPKLVITEEGREDAILGYDFDRDGNATPKVLPGYVEIDGIRLHPDRVEAYLESRAEQGLD